MDTRLRNMTSLYLTSGDRFLLLYRVGSRVVADSFTGTAGGHFEQGELNDPRACVLRELREETGLSADDIENLALRYVTLRMKNGEIRQNYYYFAHLKHPAREIASNEGRLQWFDRSELDGLAMPYTARHMLAHYCREGRGTRLLYGGVATEDGVRFTALREF